MRHNQGSVTEYITALKGSPRFGHQVAAHRPSPAIKGIQAGFPAQLEPPLIAMLKKMGISSLHSHQALAINHLINRKNVLVATPTASGKSLIYNIPVFKELLTDPKARALYIFPLKALAHDQLRVINDMATMLTGHLAPPAGRVAATYDGDTNAYQRKKIRDLPPNIIITTPDMLHLALLAHHDKWQTLFSRLTHVIIDEVHTYRGVFGSHMAWILRRLRRICALRGARPVFALSSATIGNPGDLGAALIDSSLEVITESGAPAPRRNMILLNPDDSAPYSATMLMEAALRRNLRTIVYTGSRKMTELITMWIGQRAKDLQDKISSYRAGFLPEERRRIEQELANGKLLGVISTSALELGIDIGNLDICILVGYPGSMMATLQRAGRVGRGMRESLVTMIGGQDALDQYFMRNPDEFFKRGVEAVAINPDNRSIAGPHLSCAAAEHPLTASDPLLAGKPIRRLVEHLTREGELIQAADGATWFARRKYPQRHVNLRSGGRQYLLRTKADREIIGDIDGNRALKECHEGAVYLHRAGTWLVEEFDFNGREVILSQARLPYFTRAMVNKDTEILATDASTVHGAIRAHFGRLRVTETITGYQKCQTGSQKVINTIPLDLPEQQFETKGFWLEIPLWLREAAEREMLHFMGGIHALEHAIIAMMPLLVLCDRNDIGGISYPWHEQMGVSTVFVYDGYSGGVGLSHKAFANIKDLLEKTVMAVKTCACERGCPSCVHSPKCGSGNRPIDKQACLMLLHNLLDPRAARIPHKAAIKPVAPKPAPAAGDKPTNSISLPRRYGVFDVETRLSAQEVGGWHRAERMRVSVVVLYDNERQEFVSFEEHEVERLIDRLFELDLVIGFNNKRFDNRVLSAYTQRNLNTLPALDILEEITATLGYRLSLDRLAEHTLGAQKSANGLQALKWFKEGRMDLVKKYCQKDVEITRDLFLHGLEKQYLLFKNKAGNLVRLPTEFAATIKRLRAK